jgi:hypothetical protein
MTAPQIESMGPFFIVSNVDQIIAFYQEKLGSCRRGPPKRSLPCGVRTSAPEWCRLSQNGRTS